MECESGEPVGLGRDSKPKPIHRMNSKTLLTFVATLALGFNVALAAEEDTPLAKAMSAMNKNLRTLKRQVNAGDATKKEDNLALIAKLKVNLEESKNLEPAKTKDQPAADKAAYLAKYKEQLESLGKSFDEIEVALKADKLEDAKKVFEKLSEQKEKGHKDFGADDEA